MRIHKVWLGIFFSLGMGAAIAQAGTDGEKCGKTRCKDGQECIRVKVECMRAPCPPVEECRKSSGEPKVKCDLDCPVGEVCALQEVQCKRAPCPPVAACVPAK